MPKYETVADLADKVDYEGGLESAMTYGIRASEVPEEIQADWKRLEFAWSIYKDVADPIREKLWEAYSEDDLTDY